MNQERLLKVLVAPVISEKSTMVAEKLNRCLLRRRSRRQQGRGQGCC